MLKELLSDQGNKMKDILTAILASSFFFALDAAVIDIDCRWAGKVPYEVTNGVLSVADDSETSGKYLISPTAVKIIPDKPLVIRLQAKCEKVTTRTQFYLHFTDAKGKTLKSIGSKAIFGTQDWKELSLAVNAENIPAGTAGIKLQLQPAAGAAKGTGKAYFRNIEVISDPAMEDLLDWKGAKFERVDGAIKITDNSVSGGTYSSAKLPITDFSGGLRISAEVKCEKVTTRTQMYLLALDKNGKRIKAFASKSISGDQNWQKISVSANELPVGCSALELLLQPAAGAANGTGSAYFRNIRITPLVTAKKLDALDCTKEVAFKYGNVEIFDSTLKTFPFAEMPHSARLEIQQSFPARASAVQLITAHDLKKINIAVWDQENESFPKTHPIKFQKLSGSYILDLSSLPPWRKIALEFPEWKNPEFESIRFYRTAFPEENWWANWIWYTSKRVENETVYFRKEFELTELPVSAMFQGAVDDSGNIFINGNKLVGILGRSAPPNLDIVKFLKPGRNTICAVVHQSRYAAGLLGELDLLFADGRNQKIITDKSWSFFKDGKAPEDWKLSEFDASKWGKCVELARPPLGVWGNVNYRMNASRKNLLIHGSLLPSTVEAGKSYSGKIRLTPPPEISARPVRALFKRGNEVFYTWELGVLPNGKEAVFDFDIRIGKYLAQGVYDLEFSVSGLKAVNAKNGLPFPEKITVVNPRRADSPEAKIVSFNGAPTLFINGKPQNSIFSARGKRHLTQHAKIFNQADIHLHHVYLTPQWEAPEKADFTAMDNIANALLDGDPEGFFIIKIAMRDGTAPWMKEANPDDIIVFDNGRKGNHMSLASEARKHIFGKFIKDLIGYAKKSPYADRVIGYIASEGEEGQWMHYWSGGKPQNPGTLTDYSPSMLKYFRNWLKKNYSNEAELQKAWGDNSVTFDNARIPSREMRTAAGTGAFRDPVKNRPAIDYAFALSDVTAEGIEYYAKIIKEATDNKALTGALYGHIIDLGGHFLAEQVGYIRQRKIIESPYVDYFLGPMHYGALFRDHGSPGSYDMPSPDTLALNNKIWINENDLRTHLEFPAGYAHTTRTPFAAIQVQAREVAKALCGRAGFYYFPLGEGSFNWFDDPELVTAIRELSDISAKALQKNRASASDIAVFISDESVGYLRQKNSAAPDRFMRWAIYQRANIGRIGAPFDEYLQFDIANEKLKNYKFYIFLNPFSLSEREFAAIKKISADKTKRILFLYAPGIMENSGFSKNKADILTGMDFNFSNSRKELRFRLNKAAEKLAAGYEFGVYESAAPVPIPRKFDELLAEFTDKTPAVVRKGNIFFAPAGLLNAELLRKMAIESGVEILSNDNIAVYLSKSLAAFHSSKEKGRFVFNAPAGKKMKQLYPVMKNAPWITRFQWDNTQPETRIFMLDK